MCVPKTRFLRSWCLLAAACLIVAGSERVDGRQDLRSRFKTAVELVNVNVTVTNASGRFVRGLTRDDFVVYEDGVVQSISYFSNERVPVSLGIALDTSGSMAGEKMLAAQDALNRFLFDLLGPNDEVFLYRFSGEPSLVQEWTTDRNALHRQLGGIAPRGQTALYDTVAEAVPVAQSGRHHKKALVVISDGNDNASRSTVADVRSVILLTEVLVYAVGIDAEGSVIPASLQIQRRQRPKPPTQFPLPWPFPRGRTFPPQLPPTQPPTLPPSGPPSRPAPPWMGSWGHDEERVNEAALRAMTDDSGGRTEIIHSARDLDPATAGIADELSRQYFLAYAPTKEKDGRWRSIRVEVRRGSYLVRARKGYVAS